MWRGVCGVYVACSNVHCLAPPSPPRPRVGHWWAWECGTEECVEAHTRVDIKVNISEFKSLLDSRLPFIWNGTPVAKADLEWPAWV